MVYFLEKKKRISRYNLYNETIIFFVDNENKSAKKMNFSSAYFGRGNDMIRCFEVTIGGVV